jgi:hypothetical protein
LGRPHVGDGEGYEFGETASAIHVGADFHHFAREFVADGEADLEGGACPGILIVNMNVGGADDAEGWFGNAFE